MSKLFTEFKRGTTLEGSVRYVPRTGMLENLIGCTVWSKIKDSMGKRHEVTCTVSGDGLFIDFKATPSVTKDFNIGDAYWDFGIETPDKDIIPTSTWQFKVIDFPSKKD